MKTLQYNTTTGKLLHKFILDIIKRLTWLTKDFKKEVQALLQYLLQKSLTNDYIVEGIIEDKFDLSALQQKYQVFKVVSIDDNRKGGLPHYKIGVNE